MSTETPECITCRNRKGPNSWLCHRCHLEFQKLARDEYSTIHWVANRVRRSDRKHTRSLERRNSELTARIAELEKAVADKDRQRKDAEHSVDALSGLIMNCADTLRSRGIDASVGPLDIRVIALAKQHDKAVAALAEARKDSAWHRANRNPATMIESKTPITDAKAFDSDTGNEVVRSSDMRALELAANAMRDAIQAPWNRAMAGEQIVLRSSELKAMLEALAAFRTLQPSPHDAPRTA